MDAGTTRRLANDFIDVEAALAHVYPEVRTSYDERDLIVYALGVGAGADERELRFAYEGHPAFSALPTYVVAPALSVALANELRGERSPGLNYGFERILHTAQHTELRRPLPRAATLRHRAKVKAVYDTRKYAVVVTEVRTYEEGGGGGGEELALNEFTLAVRGAGGFGGEPAPAGEANLPPSRPPDAVVEQPTREDQALLYRLSGDRNPLHADPTFARDFGLPKPILHGLCTYGFAARHALRAMAADEAGNLRSVRVKFSAPVYPGETLVTSLWQEAPTRVVFQTAAKERGKVVLSNAAVELFGPVARPQPQPEPVVAAPGAAAVQRLADRIDERLVSRVAAVIQLRVQEPASDWVLDLKSGPGAVRRGIAADAALTLQAADADLAAWLSGGDLKELLSAGRIRVVAGDGRVLHRLGGLAR